MCRLSCPSPAPPAAENPATVGLACSSDRGHDPEADLPCASLTTQSLDMGQPLNTGLASRLRERSRLLALLASIRSVISEEPKSGG